MTMRQVAIALKNIDVRLYNKFAAKANLMGAKVPFKTSQSKETESNEATPEQRQMIERALKRAQEEKRKAHSVSS